MDVNEIREYLPHRYPFLLLDRVVDVEPGKSITAIKNVTANEPFFEGHFPGMPIMPGVLIVEAMAQAAGVLGFKSQGITIADNRLYVFAGIDDVRFKRQVIPGDQLVIKVDYVSDRRDIWKFDCASYVDEKLACSATILCANRKREP